MWNQVIRGTIFFQNANHDSKYFDEFSEWDKDNSPNTTANGRGGKDKLGFLRQVKKQNKQNKAHLNKKEKEKERKRERKKKERSRHQWSVGLSAWQLLDKLQKATESPTTNSPQVKNPKDSERSCSGHAVKSTKNLMILLPPDISCPTKALFMSSWIQLN